MDELLSGWPNLPPSQIVTLDAHRQHIEYTPFLAEDRTSIFGGQPPAQKPRP